MKKLRKIFNKVHCMKLIETKKFLLGNIALIFSQKRSFVKTKFAHVTIGKREEMVGGGEGYTEASNGSTNDTARQQ